MTPSSSPHPRHDLTPPPFFLNSKKIKRRTMLLFMMIFCGCGPHTLITSESTPTLSYIETSTRKTSQGKEVKNQQTLSVDEGTLYDAAGFPFVIRGINNPHSYFKDKTLRALPTIKSLGFNTVRIIWCADNLPRHQRCDPKDIHQAEALDQILQKLHQLKLIGVLTLQNVTGSNDPNDIDKMVSYLTSSRIKQLLLHHQSYLILNIANEWYGSWDKLSTYVNTYKEALNKMRNHGLNHVVMIDARGWGQDFSSITENYQQLLAFDPQIIFSLHLYDTFADEQKIKDSFAFVRDQRIPFVAGEFACSHYPFQPPIPCETIMAEANQREQPYGYIAWSFTGNNQELTGLNLVSSDDWVSLTDYGKRIVHDENGIKASSRQACWFEPNQCL